MIEIVMDKERNLKNLKQIGTPREENKIYIENLVYSKIRGDSYLDKRVFVLMGHTERMEGRYATFVEAIIQVKDAEFAGNVPQWNNGMWSQVFREIKRMYEEMIIVGWAVDIRGMSPQLTPELERMHREHFGGVHQVLFLVDSLERDETFYIYKENRLVQKDGFYIYYRAHKNDSGFQVLDLNKEAEEENNREQIPAESVVDVDFSSQTQERRTGGRYRQLMQQSAKEESSSAGLAIAVAMLVFVLMVGAYENRDSIFGAWGTGATEAGNIASSENSTQTGNTETSENATQTGNTETSENATQTGGAEDTDVGASEAESIDTESADADPVETEAGYEIPVEGLTDTDN